MQVGLFHHLLLNTNFHFQFCSFFLYCFSFSFSCTLFFSSYIFFSISHSFTSSILFACLVHFFFLWLHAKILNFFTKAFSLLHCCLKLSRQKICRKQKNGSEKSKKRPNSTNNQTSAMKKIANSKQIPSKSELSTRLN